MISVRLFLFILGSLTLAVSGCGAKKESADLTAEEQMSEADQPASQAPSPAAAKQTTEILSAARHSLKAGQVDEAAARLAQLQVQGAQFDAQQARDYRQVLSEAYDRAIEAAQRGDPRGQAAIELLRAAAPK